MKKKDIIIAIIIIVFSLIVAWVINKSLSKGDFITTNLSLNDWLNFWGGYCGGVFALIVGYFAIIYGNRNNEKAIKLQYKMLIEQDNRKELDDYTNCLKNNLNAINLMEISSLVGTIDNDNLMHSIALSQNKRVSIYSQDLEFIYTLSLKTGVKTDLEEQYIKCWEKAKDYYSQLLDVYESLVRRIKTNQIETKLQSNINQQLNQKFYFLRIKYGNINEKQYDNEIKSYMNDLAELNKSLSTYKKDINGLTNKLIILRDKISPLYKRLFDLSVSLIKEKECTLKLHMYDKV